MHAVYLAFANQFNNDRSLLRFLLRHLTKNPYTRIQGFEVKFVRAAYHVMHVANIAK